VCNDCDAKYGPTLKVIFLTDFQKRRKNRKSHRLEQGSNEITPGILGREFMRVNAWEGELAASVGK